MVEGQTYTHLGEMDVRTLLDLVEAYPWFAPARAELCIRARQNGDIEATGSLLGEHILYFPDMNHVASAVFTIGEKDYTDDSLPSGPAPGEEQVRPVRSYIAGMDYFSREDYDSVRQSGDSQISRIAIVDPSQKNDAPSEMAAGDVADVAEVISETLAELYVDQGYPNEAIEIYNKLSLLYPEKSAYFASLIEKIKVISI